ncbi:MAG: hypothetical protein PVJ22_20760, partial [Desulfobacterales bacterium]
MSVYTSMLNDARTLHAADIIIQSNQDLSPAVIRAVARLENKNKIISARVWEFYSVVRNQNGQNSLLTKIKVVQPGYPFYGRVVLKSGRDFDAVLTSGSIVVAPALLERLQLRVGDGLRIGNTALTIADVVVQEPDQPVDFFQLGPRVFIAAEDLNKLGLVTKGSRVWYKCLIKALDKNNIRSITNQLSMAADEDQERVETSQVARSSVKRFFDNLLFDL